MDEVMGWIIVGAIISIPVLNIIVDAIVWCAKLKIKQEKARTKKEAENIVKQLTSGKPLGRTERARLNSRLSEIQMRDAGVEFFEWSTANDERVSTGPTGHKRLEGKIYRWDDPEHYPVIDADGTRGTPGQRPGCRCVALGVILEKDYKVKAIQDKDGSIHYKILRGRL